jgi:hypothetical protein
MTPEQEFTRTLLLLAFVVGFLAGFLMTVAIIPVP